MGSFQRRAYGNFAGEPPEMLLDRSARAVRVGIPTSHFINKQNAKQGIKLFPKTEVNPTFQDRYGTQVASRSSVGTGNPTYATVTNQQTVDTILGQQIDGGNAGLLDRLIDRIEERNSGRPPRKTRKTAGEPLVYNASQVSELTNMDDSYLSRYGQLQNQFVETQPVAESMRQGNPTTGMGAVTRNPGVNQLSFVDRTTGIVNSQPQLGQTTYNPLSNNVEVRSNIAPPPGYIRQQPNHPPPTNVQLVRNFYGV